MTQQQNDGAMKTNNSHPCITFPSKSKYFIVISISWVDRNLQSNYEVRAHFLSAHELYNGTKMSSKRAHQCKSVSGAFGDFYDNLDPNIRRQKRQRIYGTVTGACGEWKYTVQFDCGKVIDCFSNTLRIENSSALLPPVEIQAAISKAELEGTHAEQAVQIIRENEAAANDAIEEEHLPADSPGDEGNDDDADEASANSGTEEPEQRPVGTVSEAPAEDTTTYAGRKQATLR
jgi:hypothetical protein